MTSLLLAALLVSGPTDLQRIPARTGGWAAVQSLEPGTPVRVVMGAGAVDGDFVSASADFLVVELKKGPFRFDRRSVTHIDQRLPGSNQGQNMNRGLVAGLAGGLLRAKAACDGCSDLGRIFITGQSMLIGTIAGAVSSPKRWKTIYRR